MAHLHGCSSALYLSCCDCWCGSYRRNKSELDIFNTLDFIVLGLVLQISNINEIEHLYDSERTWKTTHNGISVILIIFYSALLVFYLLGESIPESIDVAAVKSLAMSAAPLSIGLSFLVYYRVSRLERHRTMTELLTIVGVIVIASGLGVAVWSFMDTRRKYGNRKRGTSE